MDCPFFQKLTALNHFASVLKDKVDCPFCQKWTALDYFTSVLKHAMTLCRCVGIRHAQPGAFGEKDCASWGVTCSPLPRIPFPKKPTLAERTAKCEAALADSDFTVGQKVDLRSRIAQCRLKATRDVEGAMKDFDAAIALAGSYEQALKQAKDAKVRCCRDVWGWFTARIRACEEIGLLQRPGACAFAVELMESAPADHPLTPESLYGFAAGGETLAEKRVGYAVGLLVRVKEPKNRIKSASVADLVKKDMSDADGVKAWNAAGEEAFNIDYLVSLKRTEWLKAKRIGGK